MGSIDQDHTGCGTIEDNDPVRSMRKTKGVLRNTDKGEVVNIGLIFNMIGTPADATKYRYSDTSIHETVAGVNRILNGHYGTALTAPAYRDRVAAGFNGFNINFYVQDVRRRFEMPTTWWHALEEIEKTGPYPSDLLNYKNTFTLGWGNHEDFYPDGLGIAPTDVGKYINVYVCNTADHGYPTYDANPESPSGQYRFTWGRSIIPYDNFTYPELDAFRGQAYYTQFESNLILQPFSMGTKENPVTWEEAGDEYFFPVDDLTEEQITALTTWNGTTVAHELLHWFDNRHVWGQEGTCQPLYQLPDFPSQWVRYRDDRDEGRITPGVDDQIYCNKLTDVTCDDEFGVPIPIWYSNVMNYGPYFNEIYDGQVEITRSALFQVEEDGNAIKGYFPAVKSLYGPTRCWDLNNPDELTVKLERFESFESYRAYVGDTLVWDKFSQPGGNGYDDVIEQPTDKLNSLTLNYTQYRKSPSTGGCTRGARYDLAFQGIHGIDDPDREFACQWYNAPYARWEPASLMWQKDVLTTVNVPFDFRCVYIYRCSSSGQPSRDIGRMKFRLPDGTEGEWQQAPAFYDQDEEQDEVSIDLPIDESELEDGRQSD